MITLSEQESYIIEMVREARPYEVLEIHKDKNGRPDSYFVVRTQKLVVNKIVIGGRDLQKV